MKKMGKRMMHIFVCMILVVILIFGIGAKTASADEYRYTLGKTVTGWAGDENEYYFKLTQPTKINFSLQATGEVDLEIYADDTDWQDDGEYYFWGESKIDKTLELPKGNICVYIIDPNIDDWDDDDWYDDDWDDDNWDDDNWDDDDWDDDDWDDDDWYDDADYNVNNGDVKYTLTMTDITKYANKITLSTTKCNMSVGATKTLKAQASPKNLPLKKITWTSSNTNVVTVNSSGKVTAKGLGKAKISAKLTDGNTVNCDVTVNVLNNKMIVGESQTIKLNKISGAVWSSSNKKVATVTSSGKIKAKSGGKVTLTAKKGGVTYKCNLVITNYKALAKTSAKKLQTLLVFPSSLKIKNVYFGYMKSDNSPAVLIEYSAKNTIGKYYVSYYDSKYEYYGKLYAEKSELKNLKKQKLSVIK